MSPAQLTDYSQKTHRFRLPSMPADERPDAPRPRDASHKGERSGLFLASNTGPKSRPAQPRQGKSSAPKRKPRRRTSNTQRRVRGGAASDAIPIRDSPSRDTAIRSCHLRHGQPPSSADDPPHAPHAAAHHRKAGCSWSASLPPSSPAMDLSRRIQAAPSPATAWLGRRPCIVSIPTGPGPAVQDHSRDAIKEAIGRSQAALGPVHAQRRFESVSDLEDDRSFELYWETQIARSRFAAGNGDASPSPRMQGVRLVRGFQVSAERSTACWPGDEGADSPPPDEDSSPSVGTPQHMNVNVGTMEPTDRLRA
uniref:Repressed by TUP1 protein 4 n=1 Tax=Ganoderma boninense TaxID=34458 RepID=A0A5K1K4Z4_9APHY|nr:Repressed by TUP1 protein 4 [Ganoderma boninense]